MNLNTTGLFDLSHTLAGEYLARFEYPWQALDGIKELILSLGPALGEEYEERAPQVWVHQTAKIAPTAFLGAPCIIGPDTEVRHCAFLRGSALVDKIETCRKKFVAMLGDFVEVGCNSVLNPGTVIGPRSNVYPVSCVRGVVPPDSIYKTGGVIVPKTKGE